MVDRCNRLMEAVRVEGVRRGFNYLKDQQDVFFRLYRIGRHTVYLSRPARPDYRFSVYNTGQYPVQGNL